MELDELCKDCPILSICQKNDCVGVCEGDDRSRREMIRDASYSDEQAHGADYGNI